MRIVVAGIATFLAGCATNSVAPLVSEREVLELARARTAEACKQHKYGCDIEASITREGWFVTVAPVQGIAPDGEHWYAIHSGWNFVYSPTGKFLGDRGW